MSTETGKSSTESEISGLDFEETALTLGLPGGGSRGGAAGTEPERKRGFDLTISGEDRSAESAVGPAAGASKKPAAKTKFKAGLIRTQRLIHPPPPKSEIWRSQVVGWPPVRSFRRNALKNCTYVKVAVDGAPYLRKVDLETYGGYQQLLAALEEMFTIRTSPNERRFVDPVSGTEYTPTYEDKDGDWMLVGDVPWKMFVASCKRLRLMKDSEAVNLVPGNGST